MDTLLLIKSTKMEQSQFLMQQFPDDTPQSNLFDDVIIEPRPCTGILTERDVLYSAFSIIRQHSDRLFPNDPFSSNPLDDLDIRMHNLGEYFRSNVMFNLGWSKATFYRRKKLRALSKGKIHHPAIQAYELRQIHNAAKATIKEFAIFMEKL